MKEDLKGQVRLLSVGYEEPIWSRNGIPFEERGTIILRTLIAANVGQTHQ